MIGTYLYKKPYAFLSIWIAFYSIAGFWANHYDRLPFGMNGWIFLRE